MSIGVIGCGLVGRQLVDALLARGEAPGCCVVCQHNKRLSTSPHTGFSPADIHISTRSTGSLTRYTSLGVHCTNDNASVSRPLLLLLLLFDNSASRTHQR